MLRSLNIQDVIRYFDIDRFCSAFDFSYESSYVFSGESHDFWEIVYITAGSVEVTEDNQVFLLRSGDFLLHAPMEFHSFRTASNNASGIIISFHTTGTVPNNLKHGVFSLTAEQSTEYTSIAKSIISFCLDKHDNPYFGQDCAERLSHFLIHLSECSPERDFSHKPDAILYHKIVSVMTCGVTENISLSEIALRCNISVSYLKLVFEKYASCSPKSFYMRLQTQYAIKQLSEGASIKDLSYSMNFSSPSYFSVFIKKRTGHAPSYYQKGH